MKKLPAVIATLVFLLPTAHAQSGVESMFDDALAYLCESSGDLDVGGIDIAIPGLDAIGLDLRPLCQYADIANKSTRVLKDLRNGTLSNTERLINDTIASLTSSFGHRLDVDSANEVIGELNDGLRAALEAGDGFLDAYREATESAVERLREESNRSLEEQQEEAQRAIQEAGDRKDITPTMRRHSNVANTVVEHDVNQAQLDITQQDLESRALTDASSQLLEEQANNNAYQQTIEDTLATDSLPGGRSGIAEQVTRDAQKATSVRQSINVLTEAISHQLRNDAVFSGAVIENLQANARQQVITNHQLQILANAALSQQEQELLEAETEVATAIEESLTELEADLQRLVNTVNEAQSIASDDAMDDLGFSFCGLFPGQC